ncbi:hypothetical protein B0H19DRAFT_203263 [Mycena capillaripes]|nr:hypothetical protein B0H19DRAFT_203263 [Mycena capillaripes]
MHVAHHPAVAALCNVLKRFNSSPMARILIFRAVLLSTAGTLLALVFDADFDPMAYATRLFTVLHYMVMLYRRKAGFIPYVADALLVCAETVLFCILLVSSTPDAFLWPFCAANVAASCLSLYFRFVGITFGRKLGLFNGCVSTQPPYTAAEILFGRSALRPLVRGESRTIAFVRAVILVSLFCAMPAFGFYLALLVPVQAKVMTRNIKVARPWDYSNPSSQQESSDSNASVLLDAEPIAMVCIAATSNKRSQM